MDKELIGILMVVLVIEFLIGFFIIGIYPYFVSESNRIDSLISDKCKSIGLEQIKGRTLCEGLNENGNYITKELVWYKGKYEIKESMED